MLTQFTFGDTRVRIYEMFVYKHAETIEPLRN